MRRRCTRRARKTTVETYGEYVGTMPAVCTIDPNKGCSATLALLAFTLNSGVLSSSARPHCPSEPFGRTLVPLRMYHIFLPLLLQACPSLCFLSLCRLPPLRRPPPLELPRGGLSRKVKSATALLAETDDNVAQSSGSRGRGSEGGGATSGADLDFELDEMELVEVHTELRKFLNKKRAEKLIGAEGGRGGGVAHEVGVGCEPFDGIFRVLVRFSLPLLSRRRSLVVFSLR